MALTYTLDAFDKATITGADPAATGPLVIPATIEGYPVVAIGASAFASNADITSLTIPEGLLTIGDDAFYNCYGLTGTLTFPSMRTIGEGAFYSCYGINSFRFGRNLESLGGGAFENFNEESSPGGAWSFWFGGNAPTLGGTEDQTKIIVSGAGTPAANGTYNRTEYEPAEFYARYAHSSQSGWGVFHNWAIGEEYASIYDPVWEATFYESNDPLSGVWTTLVGETDPPTSVAYFVKTVFFASTGTVYRLTGKTGWGTTMEQLPVVEVPYNDVEPAQVAYGTPYGIGATDTGTRGGGINGSGMLGML